mgnify:CR=1 FL=1|tara:strand:- start:253 stop:456 length:204 start_codon:yes stop_codon:yes gene_type:complete
MQNLKIEILAKKIPQGVTVEEYKDWIYHQLGIQSTISLKNPMIGKNINLKSDKYDVRWEQTDQESLF